MTASAVAFKREVPVRHEVDVFVAGGGPAGCAAAVMAAKHCAGVQGRRLHVLRQARTGIWRVAPGIG
jgi:alkyl hydroperoxide reductase subunit AhpF